ncbi:MAG: phage tail protein [Achromobacter veterisilvae]
MATKIVYQTDPVNRLYLYTTVANELPLAPGFFNIPFGAYEDAPPEAPEGYAAQRNEAGTEWGLVEDHRADALYLAASGAPYEVGSAVEIEGVPSSYPGWGEVPTWLTLTAPAPIEGTGDPQ